MSLPHGLCRTRAGERSNVWPVTARATAPLCTTSTGKARDQGASAYGHGAFRDALGALLGSRLLVWCVGVTAFAVHGARDPRVPHLGTVGNALAAPISRWDSVHLQAIAAHGYEHEGQTAFFPLYPLLARAVGWV